MPTPGRVQGLAGEGSLPMAEGWNSVVFNVPSNTNRSVMAL